MIIENKEGDIVGEILYFKGLDYQADYEVGYELFGKEFSGRGYMSEALLRFAPICSVSAL